MADTADRILDDLRRRREELRPLVDELHRIDAAIAALEEATGGTGNGGAPTSAQGRRRGRPRKGEPNRTDQFLALVRDGGASIPAAAKELGIGPNYLYRLANALQSEGTIRKQGREYVMNVDSGTGDSDNAEVLPEPEDADAGRDQAAGDDDLVTDEGVNEGTREIVQE